MGRRLFHRILFISSLTFLSLHSNPIIFLSCLSYSSIIIQSLFYRFLPIQIYCKMCQLLQLFHTLHQQTSVISKDILSINVKYLHSITAKDFVSPFVLISLITIFIYCMDSHDNIKEPYLTPTHMLKLSNIINHGFSHNLV